jgi:hypothetical protein
MPPSSCAKSTTARQIIDDYKTQAQPAGRLFRDAGYDEPDQLADEVFLLFEGAHQRAVLFRDDRAGLAARTHAALADGRHAPKPR